MSRFQVFKDHTITGTGVTVLVSSMFEFERQELFGADGIGQTGRSQLEDFATVLVTHVHEPGDPKGHVFKDAEEVQRALTPGQIMDATMAIFEASGIRRTKTEDARFPERGVEAEGADAS